MLVPLLPGLGMKRGYLTTNRKSHGAVLPAVSIQRVSSERATRHPTAQSEKGTGRSKAQSNDSLVHLTPVDFPRSARLSVTVRGNCIAPPCCLARHVVLCLSGAGTANIAIAETSGEICPDRPTNPIDGRLVTRAFRSETRSLARSNSFPDFSPRAGQSCRVRAAQPALLVRIRAARSDRFQS